MRKALKILGYLLGAILVFLAVLIIYASFTDYKPALVEELPVEGHSNDLTIQDKHLSLISWNIGYAGLGKSMDFFYDGGEMVRPSHDTYRQHLNAILDVLSQHDTIDFILLQEVDQNARRSFHTNQQLMLNSVLERYSSVFATNYDVEFVPLPFTSPMGKVDAGLMTLGQYQPVESKRHAFPANYSWPKNLFMLDRCFILTKYILSNGKYLVLINTHNSAFDAGGKLRKQQLEKLKKFMLKEFKAGNYVIAGGDWNLNPPSFNPGDVNAGYQAEALGTPVDKDIFPENWQWVFDPELPTNRDVSKPFDKQSTKTTIIDYYVVSPNIKVDKIKTIDLQFRSSDHQPVLMEVMLME
ncbi:MAG: hypothetical protein K9I94_07270 [Bacteroidales bacterium]|nr:hypothetical protein [Bacteroidales bacterium]